VHALRGQLASASHVLCASAEEIAELKARTRTRTHTHKHKGVGHE
jgi:hypothetical protein